MYRTPDSGVCSAPADISGECLVDIISLGFGFRRSSTAAQPPGTWFWNCFEITQEFDSIGLTNYGLPGVAPVPVLVDDSFQHGPQRIAQVFVLCSLTIDRVARLARSEWLSLWVSGLHVVKRCVSGRYTRN
jgi:hypothetical protein